MANFTSKEILSIQRVLNNYLCYYSYNKVDNNWIRFDLDGTIKRFHVMKFCTNFTIHFSYSNQIVHEYHENIHSLCVSIKAHFSPVIHNCNI